MPTLDALMIFTFFAAGSSLAYFHSFEIPGMDRPRVLLSLLLGCVFLLSLSMWGTALLPFCAFAAGIFAEHYALLAGGMDAGEPIARWGALLCGAVLIPVYFLNLAHGMSASAALTAALERGSPTARATFRRELIMVSGLTLMGYTCIFFFFE